MKKNAKYKSLRQRKNLYARRWKRRLKSKRKRSRSFGQRSVTINPPKPTMEIKYDKYIVAPDNFCIKENPEPVIKFINKLNDCLNSRRSCFVVLTNVKNMSPDAVVVLLSILGQFKKQGVKFNGNYPNDLAARKRFVEMGFIESLFDSPRITPYDTTTKNVIRKHGKSPAGYMAKDLISKCTTNIWGEPRRCQGVYRILMELMQNTHSHANATKVGEENWWMSVNYDEKRNVECFSFVDYGIGVFTSLEHKKPGTKFFGILDKIRSSMKNPANNEVLKSILDGALHKTSTGHYYRGKGLPGIKTAMNRNQVSNLYIITNDVYANVGKNQYNTLQNALSGTFIYWELTKNNICCEY